MNYLGHDQFGSIRLQIEELARIMSGYREAIIRNDIN